MSDSLKSKAGVLWKALINSDNPFIYLREHAEEIDQNFLNLVRNEVYRHPSGIFLKLIEEVSTILGELDYARQLVNAASSYNEANEYDKALTGYEHAIQIFEKWDCSTEISRCVMNIGVAYIRKGDYDTALKYLERVKKDFESKRLDVEAMRCEVKIAEIYEKQKKYQKALEIYKKAEEFFFLNNLIEESMICSSLMNVLLVSSSVEEGRDAALTALRSMGIDTGVMKIRFLQIYESKERKEMEKFHEDVKRGNFKTHDRYPPETRLDLNEPYTYNIPSTPIWPLIPLYGTTIIKLYPIKEKGKFEEYHGFDVEDIPRLVELAKDTKKVQFTLADAPTRFQDIHFLEEIFDELEPPATTFMTDFDERDIEEFLSVSYSSGFSEYCDKAFEQLGLKADLWDKGRTYAESRWLGFHDVADRVRFLIVNRQYKEALAIIATARNLLIRPYVDPLKPTFSQLRETAQYGKMLLGELAPELAKKVEFPYEVGVFLKDKLKFIVPKNVDGAIELSDKYELLDLRKVMKGLNDSIKRGKAKSVIEGSHEISEIFEEVWLKTDKLKRKEQRIERYGISLGIAAIGSIIGSSLLGGLPGLLVGLGFGVAVDKLQVSEAISKKVMKWTTQSHMMHLYDFKEKHRLFD